MNTHRNHAVPPHRRMWAAVVGAFAASLIDMAGAGSPSTPAAPTIEADLDIEQLVNLKVTSVGKKEQSSFTAPAAIYVLTQEDLHRSGVTSIPEALRLVPGLEVARVDSHNWAISSRGFNDVYANKLLVLMDGRSVYTPLFSGVFWDVQDTMLEDIDRIEVIRGPGGTLWGANAVNGVINIMSRSARHTQGGLISAGGGTEERGFGAARYGGQLGENAWYRVYGKYFNRDDSALAGGGDSNDRGQMARGGFRVDWEPAEVSRFTLQGDLYAGWLEQTYLFPDLNPPYSTNVVTTIEVTGGNLLGRWTRTFADDNELQVQAYFDRTTRDAGFYAEDRNTFDLDAQHRLGLGDRHEIVWGLGYRVTADDVRKESFAISFDPDERTDHLFSAFVQDDVALVINRLKLTLGSKFEHNDYTGFEVQPGARLAWTPHVRHTVWASISRAVQTPSRAHENVRVNTGVVPGMPPTIIALLGTDAARSESLLACELGYRVRPVDRLALDLTAFYNDYDDLTTPEPGAPFFEPDPAPPHAVVPVRLLNRAEGAAYGAESAATLQFSDRARLRLGYTYLDMDLKLKPGSAASDPNRRPDPRHQFFAHASLDLPAELKFDAMVRFVDTLRDDTVRSYVGLDLRLAWQATRNLELSVVGQNLLDDRHPEFVSTSVSVQRAEIQRGVFGKLTWRF